MSGQNATPPASSSLEVTALLMAWGGGDQSALDRLVPLVHAELHRLARRLLIASAKASEELRHILVALQSSEAFHRFQNGGGGFLLFPKPVVRKYYIRAGQQASGGHRCAGAVSGRTRNQLGSRVAISIVLRGRTSRTLAPVLPSHHLADDFAHLVSRKCPERLRVEIPECARA
jgi:hypothetical protein